MPFFLQRTYKSDLLRDFYASYVKRRGSAQESAFFGIRKLNLILNLSLIHI